MKVDKLLEGIDILIDYRIKQAIGEKIQDLNKRGVLSSSFAPNLIVSTGFVELNKQLLLTIEDFNKFKLLKDSEINHLKQYLNQIVEKQGSSLSSEAYKRTNIACEMNDLEFLKKESYKIIDIQIERMSREIISKRRTLWWEISKIAMTAIVAGFIGGYIKDWFFK